MTSRRIGAPSRAARVAALVLGILASAPARGTAPPATGGAGAATCLGDCNSDGTVGIDELVLGVGIALRQRDVSSCSRFDDNHDGTVTIDELIRAVTNALSSCASEDPLARGLASLAAGNVKAANDGFATAAAAHSPEPRAILYHALSRLLTNGFTSPQGMDLLGRALVAVRGGLEDVCALHATAPSINSLPDGAPRTGEIADTARSVLMPELQATLADLQRIPVDAVIHFDLGDLPRCLLSGARPTSVEIDHGDILALEATLYGASALLDIATAYNVDLRLQSASALPARMLFDSSPQLLTLRTAGRLASARQSLQKALSAVSDAIDSIEGETDDQSDDVLVILPQDVDDANRAKQIVDLVRQSLSGVVTLPTSLGLSAPERLNLNRFFSAHFQSLRGFIAFDANSDPDPHHFPDPTFDETLPDLTQAGVDQFIAGGPVCAVCQSDADCTAVGLHGLRCYECFGDCTGSVRRCSSRGFTQCEDGYY
jgi:hypothetical protein